LVVGGGAKTNWAQPLPPTEAALTAPFGVDFDQKGNLYLVEMTGHRVRRLEPGGLLSIVAGTGASGSKGDNGPAVNAEFNGIHNLGISPKDSTAIYLADTWNNCVRKIDSTTGRVTKVAGTGDKGFAGDGGPAVSAKFGGIYCASFDPAGEQLYLADLDNRRIRVVNMKSGLVRTVAGNGQKGVPADGAVAVEAPLVDPRAVIADASGRVYVLERSGHALRVVEPDGRIRTVVGTGEKGNSGDDGPALKATMNGPKHLCFDREGRVIVADTENHVIRRYSPSDGTIVRIAGRGRAGFNGVGGPALQVELRQPHGVYVHPDGTLYISDSGNNRVLKIVP
jgi:sugar lactone lactonase YvrE